MIAKIGLPGRFAATGLRATVQQPDSGGIPGFFVAIFSVVTQLDVCPVGRNNSRMEFLGRTGLQQKLDNAPRSDHNQGRLGNRIPIRQYHFYLRKP